MTEPTAQTRVEREQPAGKDAVDHQRHLEDPNYYRILYSLAAHQVNGALDPSGNDRRGESRTREQRLEQGRQSAEKLILASTRSLNAFTAELRKPRRRGRSIRKQIDPDPKHLSRKDRRLYTFLRDTVEPCALLLYAGASTLLGGTDGEAYASIVRKRARQDRDLPYRPLYNLACYEVARASCPEPDPLERTPPEVRKATHLEFALEALEDAFSRVHGRPRRELAQWANKDPSLEALRADSQTSSRFRDLLRLYGAEANEQDPPAPRAARTVRARLGTTRPVNVVGGKVVRYTEGALHNMAERLTEGFVPMHIEHLSYLPPVARWRRAEVLPAPDGAYELFAEADEIARRPLADTELQIPSIAELSKTANAEDVGDPAAVTLSLEPRNYDPDVFEEIVAASPVEVEEESQWGVLPPIDWIIWIGAAVGAGFFGAAGGDAWDRLKSLITDYSGRAREADRDRLVSLRLPFDGGAILAFIPLASSDAEPVATIQKALDRGAFLHELRRRQEAEELIPGLRRIAYVFDGTDWELAWLYTDRAGLATTEWLEKKAPDPALFLGHDAPRTFDEAVEAGMGGVSAGGRMIWAPPDEPTGE